MSYLVLYKIQHITKDFSGRIHFTGLASEKINSHVL